MKKRWVRIVRDLRIILTEYRLKRKRCSHNAFLFTPALGKSIDDDCELVVVRRCPCSHKRTFLYNPIRHVKARVGKLLQAIQKIVRWENLDENCTWANFCLQHSPSHALILETCELKTREKRDRRGKGVGGGGKRKGGRGGNGKYIGESEGGGRGGAG